MVDVKTETKTNHSHNSKPVNPRQAIREARQRRLRVITAGKASTIKVYAANDVMREVLRHPGSGTRFRDTLEQPVEWPNDSFTARRIADGSVRTDGPGSGEPVADNESLNPRQQSAARYGRSAIGERVNATLRLASLSPNTAVSGSEDLVMACIGTGFTPDTVIRFGDYDEPTTFVSATKVTTGVKPSLFAPAVVPVLVHTATDSSEPINFTFTATAEQTKAPKPKPAA
jgi:hypothetical protein